MAAITAAEIMFKLSVSAAAGNTTAGTPATSLGDQVSTTEVSAGALNNLFDDVGAAENAASEAEYRCFFVHNSNAANAYQNVVMWISSEVAGGASIAIGVDTTAASAVGSGSAQALTVVDENTARAGVTFTSAGSESGSTANPWFCDVISTFPVSRNFTG